MSFIHQLKNRWNASGSLVCVGLDPEPAKFPARFAGDPEAVFAFCRDIVDATAAYACCFKPQIAHFAALGAEGALARLIGHIHAAHPGIPVILDAKRGDIGSTAQRYAAEAFDRYGADAVTANPYLGRDSLQPFLDRADRGVVILCRTSNPGAGDLQDLVASPAGVGATRPLYQHVAEKVAREWNANGNCMLVVGATWPEQLREVRAIVDATADLVCCFKPQIAHFAAHAAEGALERLIAHVHAAHPGVPVILDAKRGDIGSTAQQYAAEAFDRYGADAVTANPYLGRDSVQPFLDR
ncbi:MAG: orotidine-5'-phosphate decarboxylase, partial [Luteimonas sp.]